MSSIEDLQARITVALERLAKAVDGLDANAGVDVAALEERVEEERLAAAQLEERLRALQEEHAAELRDLREQSEEMRATVDAVDLELQRLRKANAALREANVALREANEAGVGDPDLINRSMVAELEAMRAARAAEVAEANAILSALAPILSDGDSRADNEEAADA